MVASLLQYKAWANALLLEAIAGIDATRFGEHQRKAIRVMNHTWVVDRIFAAHLSGATRPFDATNTDDTPDMATLVARVHASDAELIDLAAHLPPERLDQRVRFHFTDGQRGEMSRAEMLQHLIAHGAYHRGAIGQILDSLDLPRPADSITVFLHAVEPSRRNHAGLPA